MNTRSSTNRTFSRWIGFAKSTKVNGRAGTTKQVISVNVGGFVCSLLCSAELVFQITGGVICIPLLGKSSTTY